MTCDRLATAELVPDAHTKQCPDCRAQLAIAGWLADGRTSHRASADWRRRTLAHVRALASAAPAPAPVIAPEIIPVEAIIEPAPSRVHALLPRRRSRWLIAFPLAGAAAIAVLLLATSRDHHDILTAHLEPQLAPPTPYVAPPAPPPTTPSVKATPPGRGSARPSIRPPAIRETRGAPVIVDWGDDPPTLELALDSIPTGAELLLDGVHLGTTPFRGAIPAGPAGRTLTLRLAGYHELRHVLTAADVALPPFALTPLAPRRDHCGDGHTTSG